MEKSATEDWFSNIDSLVSEPLKFKVKLAIGEDAYTLLRLKNATCMAWDTLGAASTTAAIAKSSIVASTFFAPSGFLGIIGIGTAATPIGWVIAASVISGGAWIGVTRYLKNATENRVTVIPEFINTPIDVLGLALFDLMAPLALKVAIIDGNIDPSERELIKNYFYKSWGYNLDFVEQGILFTESRLSELSVKDLAKALAEFKLHNPDCNYKSMSQEILTFLRNIAEADGRIDEREEMAISLIADVFDTTGKDLMSKAVKSRLGKIKKSVTGVLNKK